MDLSCSLLVDDNSLPPGKFFVQLPRTIMLKLKLNNDSMVEVTATNSNTVVCSIKSSHKYNDNKIYMNNLIRQNLQVLLSDPITVRPCLNLQRCKIIDISIDYNEKVKTLGRDFCLSLLNHFFKENPTVLCKGNKFIVKTGIVEFVVENILPAPYSLIDSQTKVKIQWMRSIKRYIEGERRLNDISYENISGFKKQLKKLREMEFPLRFPSLFKQLNIDNPHVLMQGPEGVGKRFMAQCLANETNAQFLLFNESILSDLSYEAAIKSMRTLLKKVKKHSTSVVCFDSLDKMVPNMVKRTIGYGLIIQEFVRTLKQLQQDKDCVLVVVGIAHVLLQVNTTVLDHFYNTYNNKEIVFKV